MREISQIRVGDVLLVRRPPPPTATRVEGVQGLRVPGERSGHEHVLAGAVLDTPAGRLLRLDQPEVFRTVRSGSGEPWPERHADVVVPAGWWEPVTQRQYVPSARPVSRARFD